jgi:undecaprenyl-diphosphatase
MVNIIQAIIFSVIQGITEWLPISSSGHLAILHNIFGFQSLSYDVFLHFAGVLAVIFVFWKDITKLLNFLKIENLRYICLIILGIIPAGLLGFLFKKQIESFFSRLFYLGIFFIISGVIVYLTKYSREKNKELSWYDSLFIGFFQAIAILPGISRSGATISSSLYRGLNKKDAIKFSFFLAIPVILGASLLEVKDLIHSQINIVYLIISFTITFIVSILTIKILLRVLKTDKFYLFGIYNFIVGILILIFYFFINR